MLAAVQERRPAPRVFPSRAPGALASERWMSAALTLLLGLAPFLFGCIEPWSRALLNAGVLILAVAWVATARDGFPRPTIAVFAAGGLALLAFSQTWTVTTPWSIGPLLRTASRDASFEAAGFWITSAVLLWMGGAIFQSETRRRAAIYVLMAAVTLFAALGIVLRIQNAPLVFGRPIAWVGTFFGPYVNGNQAAGLMAMVFCLGAGLWAARFYSFEGWHLVGEQANFWSIQVLGLAFMGLLGLAIVMTESRGAIHAWSLSSLVSLAAFTGLRRARGLAVLIAVAALYVTISLFFSRSLGFSPDGWDGPTQERLAIWESALSLFRDRPLLGSGLGAFSDVFAAYQPSWLRGKVEHAHCDWLEILCGGGILGGGLFMLALLAPMAAGLGRLFREADPASRCLEAGGLAAAGGFMLQGLIDFPLQMPANAGIFFLVLSWLGRPEIAPVLRRRRVFPALLLLAALANFVILAIRPIQAWAWAHRKVETDTAWKASNLEAALRWNAFNAYYRHLLGGVYLAMARETPIAGRIFTQKALRHAEACLADNPLSAECLEVAGAALQGLGRGDDGERRFLEADRLRPWHSRPLTAPREKGSGQIK